MLKMNKTLVAIFTGACLMAAAGVPTEAFAQITVTGPKAAKPSTHKRAKKAARHRLTREEKRSIVTPLAATIPPGAERWRCTDQQSLYIAGNMKRDQILTLYWDGKNYKLPREATTTGADRFYDAASGMDLVVIPMKAMLFSDKGDRTRLADECKTQAMMEQNAPAPTQANELLHNLQK